MNQDEIDAWNLIKCCIEQIYCKVKVTKHIFNAVDLLDQLFENKEDTIIHAQKDIAYDMVAIPIDINDEKIIDELVNKRLSELKVTSMVEKKYENRCVHGVNPPSMCFHCKRVLP